KEGRHHGCGVKGWRLFDANYGCFWSESDQDFEEFIDWYMSITGYYMKFAGSVQIVGVNPFDSLTDYYLAYGASRRWGGLLSAEWTSQSFLREGMRMTRL